MLRTNDSIQKLRKSIHDCIESIQEELTDSDQFGWLLDERNEILARKLCIGLQEQSNLSPLALFDLDKGSLLTIINTSITFIVVLVQFKTAELPLKAESI